MKIVSAPSATVTMRRIAVASTSSMKDSSTPCGARRRANQTLNPSTRPAISVPASSSEMRAERTRRKLPS